MPTLRELERQRQRQRYCHVSESIITPVPTQHPLRPAPSNQDIPHHQPRQHSPRSCFCSYSKKKKKEKKSRRTAAVSNEIRGFLEDCGRVEVRWTCGWSAAWTGLDWTGLVVGLGAQGAGCVVRVYRGFRLCMSKQIQTGWDGMGIWTSAHVSRATRRLEADLSQRSAVVLLVSSQMYSIKVFEFEFLVHGHIYTHIHEFSFHFACS